jgi:hypothetical protein
MFFGTSTEGRPARRQVDSAGPVGRTEPSGFFQPIVMDEAYSVAISHGSFHSAVYSIVAAQSPAPILDHRSVQISFGKDEISSGNGAAAERTLVQITPLLGRVTVQGFHTAVG